MEDALSSSAPYLPLPPCADPRMSPAFNPALAAVLAESDRKGLVIRAGDSAAKSKAVWDRLGISPMHRVEERKVSVEAARVRGAGQADSSAAAAAAAQAPLRRPARLVRATKSFSVRLSDRGRSSGEVKLIVEGAVLTKQNVLSVASQLQAKMREVCMGGLFVGACALACSHCLVPTIARLVCARVMGGQAMDVLLPKYYVLHSMQDDEGFRELLAVPCTQRSRALIEYVESHGEEVFGRAWGEGDIRSEVDMSASAVHKLAQTSPDADISIFSELDVEAYIRSVESLQACVKSMPNSFHKWQDAFFPPEAGVVPSSVL